MNLIISPQECLKELIDRGRDLQRSQYDITKISSARQLASYSSSDLTIRNWKHDVKAFNYRFLRSHSVYKLITESIEKDGAVYVNFVINYLEIAYGDFSFWDSLEKQRRALGQQAKETVDDMYDVFISHANADKEGYVDDLKQSLERLGVRIFYDKDTLEWGDNWKNKILDGVRKAEFAIIVISQNFFGREWTEKELVEFLDRQNQNGQKIILPILHNITIAQLRDKYPAIADIQALDSSKSSCDEIAVKFAAQFIKRLKRQG